MCGGGRLWVGRPQISRSFQRRQRRRRDFAWRSTNRRRLCNRNKFLLAIPLIFQFYKTSSNFVCFCRSMNSTNQRTGAKKSRSAAVPEDRGKKSWAASSQNRQKWFKSLMSFWKSFVWQWQADLIGSRPQSRLRVSTPHTGILEGYPKDFPASECLAFLQSQFRWGAGTSGSDFCSPAGWWRFRWTRLHTDFGLEWIWGWRWLCPLAGRGWCQSCTWGPLRQPRGRWTCPTPQVWSQTCVSTLETKFCILFLRKK